MIRPATENDLRRIVEMAEKFYPLTSYWTLSKIPFNADHVAAFTLGLIDNGIVHVVDLDGEVVGVIGIILMPFLFNPKYIHAGEVLWWVEPEFQKNGWGERLIQAAEASCKDRGVTHIQLLDLPNSSTSAASLYTWLGYELTERSYTKVV